MPSPHLEGRSARSAWAFFAVCALALVAVYAPALHGTPVWDDDMHMTGAARRGFGGLVKIWFDPGTTPQYYPLTHTLFWIQDQLWRAEPLGHHLVNVLLHAANAALVFVVLRRLAVPGAWFAAALFAFHPVQVESVAWISELKNTLSGCFYLASLALLLPWLLAEDAQREGQRRVWLAALSLFLAALLSKAVTATLPAAALLIVWWKHGALSWRRHVVPLLPFFALALVFGTVSILMERHVVGAKDEGDALSFAERWLVAGRALWFYLSKLVWPAQLIFTYERWVLSSADLAQWAYTVAAVATLAGLVLLHRRLGRGPATVALFFVGTLVPALGFVNVFPFRYAFVADHFQYLACAGVFAGAAALLAGLVQRLGAWPGRIALGVPLALLAFLSWRLSAEYQSSETLWRAILDKNPRCWMAASNLGSELRLGGRVEEGMQLLRRAIEIDPSLAEPRFNLGNALAAQGQHAEAVLQFEGALARKPAAFDILSNLGISLAALGRRTEAIARYREALEIEPRFAIAHINLAQVLRQDGQLEASLESYQRAIELSPNHADTHAGRAKTLAELGRMDEAQASFLRATQLAPNDPEARYNYGLLLGKRGDYAGAARQFEQALRLRPNYPAASDALTKARAALQTR